MEPSIDLSLSNPLHCLSHYRFVTLTISQVLHRISASEEEGDSILADSSAVIARHPDAGRRSLFVLRDANVQVCWDQRWGKCVGPFV